MIFRTTNAGLEIGVRFTVPLGYLLVVSRRIVPSPLCLGVTANLLVSKNDAHRKQAHSGTGQ